MRFISFAARRGGYSNGCGGRDGTLQSRIGANRNRAGNVWIEANIAKLPALLGKP
jgi:hypothetical protein